MIILIVVLAISIQLFSWWCSGVFYEKSVYAASHHTGEEKKWTFWWIISIVLRSLFVTVALLAFTEYDFIGWLWISILVAKFAYIRNRSEFEIKKSRFGQLFLKIHGFDTKRLGERVK